MLHNFTYMYIYKPYINPQLNSQMAHFLFAGAFTCTVAKRDSTSSLPTISKKCRSKSFRLHAAERRRFFGAGGQLRVGGIMCWGDLGVWQSSSLLLILRISSSVLIFIVIGTTLNSRSVDMVGWEVVCKKWRSKN